MAPKQETSLLGKHGISVCGVGWGGSYQCYEGPCSKSCLKLCLWSDAVVTEVPWDAAALVTPLSDSHVWAGSCGLAAGRDRSCSAPQSAASGCALQRSCHLAGSSSSTTAESLPLQGHKQIDKPIRFIINLKTPCIKFIPCRKGLYLQKSIHCVKSIGMSVTIEY